MRPVPPPRAALRLAGLTAVLLAASALPTRTAPPRAKNVILMVGDGMGFSYVTAARLAKGGVGGPPLSFETLERFGYQWTFSSNGLIADSAATSSAWACGAKFANGALCWFHDGRPAPSSLLDLARASGRATGLVATSTITHATPAAFGASVPHRECEPEIARQYLADAKPDLLLGGGRARFQSPAKDACGGGGADYLELAKRAGYAVVTTAAELRAANGPGKLLGLFAAEGMTRVQARPPGTTEPTLAEMTGAALSRLAQDRDGFFLMVEGSQIDWGGHENDLGYAVSELLAFDDAVRVVQDWIAARRDRAAETLLIVLADHETGGLSLVGPADRPAGNGPLAATPRWATTGHTAADAPIWSSGPGSAALGGLIDNTKIYEVVRGALGK
ncbi:MAG: alkaline phosphatase [Acidobacteria bacterium]|jgi:alkaline phosphatase|nr:alkaline phosphatase [Acidobacteriota bacterium]